jgi:quercetin dioxygenase-like cupin family protein
MEYCDAVIPFDSLIAFHENLSKNPSEHVKKELWKFLDRSGHPLTEDGCFIAYRKCRDDYMDGHSGTFRNMIGDICTMPREQCDSNPDQTCSRGLHAASYRYASHFLYGGHLMAVKINPEDVVSIPNEYGAEKLRCCKFEVIDEIDKPYEGLVHTDANIQLVLMSLAVGDTIHKEKHKSTTQFFRVEKGQIKAIVAGKTYNLKDGDTIIIPPNTWHEIIQIGSKPAKLYTIYSPPEHPPNRKDKHQPEND